MSTKAELQAVLRNDFCAFVERNSSGTGTSTPSVTSWHVAPMATCGVC